MQQGRSVRFLAGVGCRHIIFATVASAFSVLGLKRSGESVVVDAVLSFDAEGAKNRPVSKVVTLLKDMQKQLQKEAGEDEEIYDKISCWCETNDQEKTQAIAGAEARIDQLTTRIGELTARIAHLGTEIEHLEKEVAQNEAALSEATALRQKQLAQFNAEEKELLESISALTSAIAVLSKHHTSLVQVPHTYMLGIATMLQHEVDNHAHLLQGVLTPSSRRTVGAFVQAPEDYFDATPTFKQSYAPQSGQIFGILRQMKETFESNLVQSQGDEALAQKEYTQLKQAKEAQIAAGKTQLETKRGELADANLKLVVAKQDIEDTRASLSADELFLLMLKEKCSLTDKEWEERQRTRQLEIAAVSKALVVLSAEDAHDLFTRTFNPALLQAKRSQNSARRTRAAELLSSVASRLGSPRLATIAARIRLDAFTRVKKAIDDMITVLSREKVDEIKHKDFCTDELNTNQLQTQAEEHEKQDLSTRITDLEMTIEQLQKTIDALKSEIKESQIQLKRAGEDREKQNKDFQSTVADQRETQKLLQQALGFLKTFYAHQARVPSLLQKQEPVGPPPPPGFDAYRKSPASGGVLSLIEQIISDAKAMETDTIRAEADAQKAYEAFVNDTNNSIETKNSDIIHKSKAKAQAEVELVQVKKDKESVMQELERLSNYNSQLHSSCDYYIFSNFELRQTSRDEEIEALKQAKAILSGADFDGLSQA